VGVADQVLQHLRPALEGASEALLLVGDPAHDGLPLRGELGIRGSEELESTVGETLHERRLQVDRPALLDRPPHDPAQDVAAVLVGRDHPVRDQRGGARVVGQISSRGWSRRRR
jgi:hypothetical protein